MNFTSAEGSPASVKTEGGGTRVHRVNWTFPVFSADGWDLLEAYDSASEEGEEYQEPQDVLPFSAGPLTPEKEKAEKLKKHRMALKTVLEALIAEEEDEETQQRLPKKEYKSARRGEAASEDQGVAQEACPRGQAHGVGPKSQGVAAGAAAHVRGGEADPLQGPEEGG